MRRRKGRDLELEREKIASTVREGLYVAGTGTVKEGLSETRYMLSSFFRTRIYKVYDEF